MKNVLQDFEMASPELTGVFFYQPAVLLGAATQPPAARALSQEDENAPGRSAMQQARRAGLFVRGTSDSTRRGSFYKSTYLPIYIYLPTEKSFTFIKKFIKSSSTHNIAANMHFSLHFFCCGKLGGTLRTARPRGWPRGSVHRERVNFTGHFLGCIEANVSK